MPYTVTFPRYFEVTLYINGMRFFLSELADMKCSGEWCMYEFDDEVIDKLNTTNCSVIVEKYYVRYTLKLSYTCKEFVEFLKELNG
jgi:hypothetical protein